MSYPRIFRLVRLSALGCCVCLVLAGSCVHAQMTIEITQGNDEATPVAIVPFAGQPGATGLDIAELIGANLRRSGRFRPLPSDDMLSLPGADSKILYTEWRQLGTEYLVVGAVYEEGDLLRLKYDIHNVRRAQRIHSGELYSSAEELRRSVHRVSDAIYTHLTGVRGAFSTRIAYTLKQSEAPRYSLHVADADGGNDQVLFRSHQPILSPQWSPRGEDLAYVSFEPGYSSIYLYNFAERESRPLFRDVEYSSAPAWSADGRSMAVVLTRDANVDIYVSNLGGTRLRRITHHFAIDTEPTFSHDGRYILFTSDRGGTPQVYRVATAGGTPQKMTSVGKYNARPLFLPDDSGMVLVHGVGGDYHIARQDFATGTLRVLTETMLDESPTVAPNGHMLMYASNYRDRGVMVVISIPSGAAARLRSRAGEVGDPAWSPFIY